MERMKEKGVSDIVVIVFMFILLVISATLLLGYSSKSLETSIERQTELKAHHLHKTLERAEIRPGITALEAIAEQIVIKNPTIDNQYLKNWMENTLDFLKPQNHGVEIKVSSESKIWRIRHPPNIREKEISTLESTISIVKSEGEIVNMDVEIRIFKI